MSEKQAAKPSVEHLPNQRSTIVTDELNKILTMLKGASPESALISFDFDGRLHVHVDVRSFEDLGSGLIGHSQKMTVAARATAEKKTVGQRS